LKQLQRLEQFASLSLPVGDLKLFQSFKRVRKEKRSELFGLHEGEDEAETGQTRELERACGEKAKLLARCLAGEVEETELPEGEAQRL